MLRVAGLAAERYMLKVDDRVVGSFSREQLSMGINLALFSTPMESQSRDVDGIEQTRMRLDEAVFNLVIETPKRGRRRRSRKNDSFEGCGIG